MPAPYLTALEADRYFYWLGRYGDNPVGRMLARRDAIAEVRDMGLDRWAAETLRVAGRKVSA